MDSKVIPVMDKKRYKIILASNSPRRKELLAGLDIPFEVKVIPGIDESYPESLDAYEVAGFISKKKAAAYHDYLKDMTMGMDLSKEMAKGLRQQKDDAAARREATPLLLTADTVVIAPSSDENLILGKPKDAEEARAMLRLLSGKTHHVVTGVCLTTLEKQRNFSVTTEVTFKVLTDEEIDYYIERYKPFDKAGAYGIQEWIGYIGCTGLKGSYYNVMGLPVQRIYEELQNL